MVDHRNVEQTYLHWSSTEKRLLDSVACPFDLLVDIIFIYWSPAVKDRTAVACFAGIENDERNRSLAEGIIERRRIRVRKNVRYELSIVTASFVVTTCEMHRQTCRKGAERLKNVVDKCILHIVTGTCYITVQEKKRMGR